ncbi:hypothetical protein Syun_002459 [Stephania yunnanensis]|uniref:DUF7138 domain-containing protein n=1 Tax=Stephania yunnanensis TaxID=152371 RepID=A0AAP0Q8T5_9MAGN
MTLAAEEGGDDNYATFPVVFFDGEREIDIGNITVDGSLEFRHFQSMLCNKIGIAPHQISVSLIRKKKSRSSGPRKISVTDKFNFGSIVNETHRDCFFVAVLKRSRRDRDRDRDRDRRSSKQNRDHSIDQDQIYLASSPTPPVQRASFAMSAPEKVLLRRQSDSESDSRILRIVWIVWILGIRVAADLRLRDGDEELAGSERELLVDVQYVHGDREESVFECEDESDQRDQRDQRGERGWRFGGVRGMREREWESRFVSFMRVRRRDGGVSVAGGAYCQAGQALRKGLFGFHISA